MKTQFLVALMVTIVLMTTATIAISMLENGNGHMQTAHAVIDSSCGTWYNPECRMGGYPNENWYD